MANPNNNQDLPDLEEFARKINEAAAGAEKFSESVGAGLTGSTGTVQQANGQPPSTSVDQGLSRDLLNMMSLIHDEAVAIRGILEELTK
jgi:hypothetical protein